MFRKKPSRAFPEGTFIPTPARVILIIQLCFAFSLCLWHLSSPFAKEYFESKETVLLFQNITGDMPGLCLSEEDKERLKTNQSFFENLEPFKQKDLLKAFESFQTAKASSFFQKMKKSLTVLLFKVPLFERLWIICSILLSIFALQKIKGAKEALWMLPLIACLYLYALPKNPKEDPEESLYPSEQLLIASYLKKPLSKPLLEQKKELIEGLKLYLVDRWAKQTASSDPEIFERQVAEGEFAFNLERLKIRLNRPEGSRKESTPSGFLALLYLVWNTAVPWIVNRFSKKTNKQQYLQNSLQGQAE